VSISSEEDSVSRPFVSPCLTALVILVFRLPASGDAKPDPKPLLRTDLHGEPLPPGATARMGTARLRHTDVVNCVAFAPDGKTLASGSADRDGTVRVWETASGRMIRERPGNSENVHGLAFDPQGKVLAVACGGRVCLWDLHTGKDVRELETRSQMVLALAFAPDGRVLAAGDYERTIHLWDTATGKLLHRFQGHQRAVRSVAFAPDGRTLASSSSDRTLALWDVATGKELFRSASAGFDIAVAFSPDGTLLAAGGTDQVLRLWQVATRKEVARIPGHASSITALAFSPDGKRLVTGGHDDTVRVWQVATGEERHRFRAHRGGVNTVAFSADGRTVASGGNDDTVRLWDAETGKELHGKRGHTKGILFLALSPDGRTLATGGKTQNVAGPEAVRLWDVATGRELRVLGGQEDAHSCAFSPDGKLLAAGLQGAVCVWETDSGRERARFQGSALVVLTVAFAPDGRTLAAAGAGVIHLWDLTTGKERHRFTAPGIPDHRFDGLTFSADGKRLWVRYRNYTVHWDLATGRESHPFGIEQSTWTAAVSPDGLDLAWVHDLRTPPVHRIRLRRAGVAPQERTLEGDLERVTQVAFSADGRYLAAGDARGAIRLWELRSGIEVLRLQGDPAIVTGLAFTADGRSLVSSNTLNTALVWHLAPRGGTLNDPGQALGPRTLDFLWEDLAALEAAPGYRAIWTLLASPGEAVPFLEERLLGSVPAAEVERVRQLLIDLGSNRFAVREKAGAELARMGEQVRPALMRVAALPPTPEVRRRAVELLKESMVPEVRSRTLRWSRSIEVLERIGTREARQLLHMLAADIVETNLTQQARDALDRLSRRTPVVP
jgi:WD40 repeat protein